MQMNNSQLSKKLQAGLYNGDKLLKAKKPHILLVDDEASLLRSLKELFSINFSNFDISTAASAEEALEILYYRSADLLITDLKLPEMNGLELTKNVKNSFPKTESILMTAYGNEEIYNTALELGCLAFLEKPFNIDALIKHAGLALKKVEESNICPIYLSPKEVVKTSLINKKYSLIKITSQNNEFGYIITKDGLIIHAEFKKFDPKKSLIELLSIENTFIEERPISSHIENTLSVPLSTFDNICKAASPDKKLNLVKGNNSLNKRLVEGEISQVMRPRREKNPYYIEKKKEIISDPFIIKEEATHDISALVNMGIKYFKEKNLMEAKRYWIKALKIDQNCKEAKNNLRILKLILDMKTESSMH